MKDSPTPPKICPKNKCKIKKLKKQKDGKQAGQNEKKKGLQHVGAGREKRRQEEQMSRSQDVQNRHQGLNRKQSPRSLSPPPHMLQSTQAERHDYTLNDKLFK